MNMNDLEKLITERFDKLELLLAGKAKLRKVRGETSRNLTQARVDAVESFFWKLVNSPHRTRRDTYKFSKYLLRRSVDQNIEALNLSVLINQVALRKAFQTRGEGDAEGSTPQDLARKAVENSNLIILPANSTELDTITETLLALSPGEALRIAKASAPLPRVFVGWTCSERAKSFISPAGTRVNPPEDPCGPRNWSVADSGFPVVRKSRSKPLDISGAPDVVKEDPFDKLIREQAEDQDDSEVIDNEVTDEDAFVEEEDDTPPKVVKPYKFKL